MLIALAAGLALANENITLDTKPIKAVMNHKAEFQLGAGSRSHQGFVIPSNSPLAVPVTIRYRSYLRGTTKLAPEQQTMYLTVNSSHSEVYDSYNLQKVEKSPYPLKCSVKNGLAEFSLSIDKARYDVKGSVEASVIRLPEKMTPSAYSGDEKNFRQTYSLSRAGDYPISASVTLQIAPTSIFIPTYLTITVDGKQIYHERHASHKLVLRVKEPTSVPAKVEFKLYSNEPKPDQKPKIAFLCYPTLSSITLRP